MQNIQLKLQVLETLPAVENFLLEASKNSLVHGDFHNENLIFKDNKAIHVLNLEEIKLESVDKLYYTP